MIKGSRYRCPACNFPVFNRRVARCESCAAALPAGLLFTDAQIAGIDAEHARNEQMRAELAKSSEQRRSSDGADFSFDLGSGDAVGDDGGGGDGGGGD